MGTNDTTKVNVPVNTATATATNPETVLCLVCSLCRQLVCQEDALIRETLPTMRSAVYVYELDILNIECPCYSATNPSDVRFDVIRAHPERCDIQTTGTPTPEYSWFPPYAWKMVHCGGCMAHLGWHFEMPTLEQNVGPDEHHTDPEDNYNDGANINATTSNNVSTQVTTNSTPPKPFAGLIVTKLRQEEVPVSDIGASRRSRTQLIQSLISQGLNPLVALFMGGGHIVDGDALDELIQHAQAEFGANAAALANNNNGVVNDDDDGEVYVDDVDDDVDDDDDDDDDALLQAELERIKKERAEEAARKAAEEADIREKERQEQIIRGNPLLDLSGESDHNVKRRWDDDVVFKNTCKGEPLKKKRFINDTVRNDFHKKFLQKYIK
eukprot:c1306_g2_i1.p1 GENE.c1306_g2_i1~~c1306_g2_i1.p1  ORF type:complete len:399 (+),score=72.76 c1306_g2_i1:50-1198(+)